MSSNNENIILDIGIRFRMRRDELHYSQRDVAQMTGLTTNTIAAVEKGKGTTIYNFLSICGALKIQPKSIFEKEIDLKPLYDIEPESKRRIEITQKLDDLVYNSDFFDTQRRVSEVLAKLKSDKNDSNKFSVYLTEYCKHGILEYQKVGNFKLYRKKLKLR
ncbi:helix-turn-helix domain-containing protein [Sphingobacterium sp. KU25419]|nr:helix-turn-helix domain-containing protein [Sphingobacterium sp. KU25419]